MVLLDLVDRLNLEYLSSAYENLVIFNIFSAHHKSKMKSIVQAGSVLDTVLDAGVLRTPTVTIFTMTTRGHLYAAKTKWDYLTTA